MSFKITTLTMEILWDDNGKVRPPEDWNWPIILAQVLIHDERVNVEFEKVEDAE